MQRLKPSLQNSFKKKLKSAKIRITNLLITNPRAVKIATNCLVEKYSIGNISVS